MPLVSVVTADPATMIGKSSRSATTAPQLAALVSSDRTIAVVTSCLVGSSIGESLTQSWTNTALLPLATTRVVVSGHATPIVWLGYTAQPVIAPSANGVPSALTFVAGANVQKLVKKKLVWELHPHSLPSTVSLVVLGVAMSLRTIRPFGKIVNVDVPCAVCCARTQVKGMVQSTVTRATIGPAQSTARLPVASVPPSAGAAALIAGYTPIPTPPSDGQLPSAMRFTPSSTRRCGMRAP